MMALGKCLVSSRIHKVLVIFRRKLNLMPSTPIFHICQLAKVHPIVKEMVKQHSELLFSNHLHWSFICKHPVTFWCSSYNYYPHCNMGKTMKKSVSCSKVDIYPCKLMLDNQDAVISQSTEKYSHCKGGWEIVIFYIYFVSVFVYIPQKKNF